MVGGAAPHEGPQIIPKSVISRELENAGKHGPGGKGKEWTNCVAEGRRLFDITGDWSTAALDPEVWYSTVYEGGCRFMAVWVREEERTSENRQRKREIKDKRRTRLRLHLG